LARPDSRYFVLRDSTSAVLGFAILQGFNEPDRKLHLKRIAVRDPGVGLGSILLEALLERIYASTKTNRIDLDLFVGNDRARRTYEKAGFRLEGVLRDYHRNSDGSFDDMWLMSLLRRDWEVR
jgi:RimJ/RimL family protein N-acetyltransferase